MQLLTKIKECSKIKTIVRGFSYANDASIDCVTKANITNL